MADHWSAISKCQGWLMMRLQYKYFVFASVGTVIVCILTNISLGGGETNLHRWCYALHTQILDTQSPNIIHHNICRFFHVWMVDKILYKLRTLVLIKRYRTVTVSVCTVVGTKKTSDILAWVSSLQSCAINLINR